MWNTQLGKTIRWILYLPSLILALGLITFLFIYLTSIGVEMLSSMWGVILLIALAGLTWTFFGFISTFLSSFVIHLCPNRLVGAYSLIIVASLNFGLMLYSIWSQDNFTTGLIVISAIVSILVLKLWTGLVFVSFSRNHLNEL